MGLVHRATLSPSKQELVEAWLGTRSWASGLTIASKLGEYRFDDPAGEVGVETILWATEDATVLQTPLTYRGRPLDGGEEHLVGPTEHSVLGRRWVYDGCGDLVWAGALTSAILTGGRQAPIYLEENGERIDIPPRVRVRGSGRPDADVPLLTSVESVSDDGPTTIVRSGEIELVVARIVGTPIDAEERLVGQLADGNIDLAGLRRC